MAHRDLHGGAGHPGVQGGEGGVGVDGHVGHDVPAHIQECSKLLF